jgi:microcystin-dependent protein
MANYEATRYDFDGASLSGIEGIPTATIVPWSDSSVPSGFLECNGSAVSRSTYAALFAIIGVTYGSGDGSTTFNVPDLQDNVAVGKSGTKNLASTGGANTVTATGSVAGSTANATLTTAQLASHSHSSGGGNGNTGMATEVIRARNTDATGAAGQSQGHAHNMSANFVGDATSVVQPYLTIIYIIKT